MADVDTSDNKNNPEKNKPEDNNPPFWRLQHIIPIISIIIAVIAIYLGYFKGENKRIDFTCISEFLIADIDQDLHEDLKLSFKNDPISNASLIIFSCKNSGNMNLFFDQDIQKAQHLIPNDQRQLFLPSGDN